MDLISFTVLLEYLYKKFIVTFILCLIGSFIRESLGGSTKITQISPTRITGSAVFGSIIMCALLEYIKVPFSIYACITIVVGIWSPQLLQLVMDANIMKKFTKNLLKQIKDPIAKAIVSTEQEIANEIEKDNDEQKEENKNSDGDPPQDQ